MNEYRVVMPGAGYSGTDYVDADYFEVEDYNNLVFYRGTYKVAVYTSWLYVSQIPKTEDDI